MKLFHAITCGLALAAVARAQASVSVTGTITYADRSFTFNGMPAATTNRPARFVDVDLVTASGTILPVSSGSAFTNANGTFSFTVTVTSTQFFQVVGRARTARAFAAGACPVSASATPVPTAAIPNPPAYATPPSPVFTASGFGGSVNTGTLNVPSQTVNIGTLVAAGNPFNIVDCSVRALQYVTAPPMAFAPAALPMTYRWPVPGTGSFAFFGTQIANIDETSGYDDAVILHETGHLVEGQYSFPTQPGLAHTFGQSDQDPRLSWSEGWATYFGAATMRNAPTIYTQPGIYLDTLPTTTAGGEVIGLRAQLENFFPFNSATSGPNRTAGEADELAVAGILWDISDNAATVGSGPVDDDPLNGATGFGGTAFPAGSGERQSFVLFNGPMNNSAIASTTLATFWDAWVLSVGAPALIPPLQSVFSLAGVNFAVDAFEPNDVQASAPSITPSNNWITGLTTYNGSQTSVVPNNFERDIDWYAFNVVAGSTFTVETRYPGNAVDAETMDDTFINVFGPTTGYGGGTDSGGVGRNASMGVAPSTPLTAFESGTFNVVVLGGAATFTSPGRRYGRYEMRLRMLTINAPPVINMATANYSVISTGATAALTLTAAATDPQNHPITYQWRRVGNPAVIATGAVFSPSLASYGADTTENFEVTAVDSLNAPSAPSVVVVRIVPTGQVFWSGSLSIGQSGAVNMSMHGGDDGLIGLDVALVPPIVYPGYGGALELNPATVFIWTQATAGPSGIISSPVAIPNSPSLIGVPAYWQGFYGSPLNGYAFTPVLTVAAQP